MYNVPYKGLPQILFMIFSHSDPTHTVQHTIRRIQFINLSSTFIWYVTARHCRI